jgi:hypothetical protein
MDRKDILKYVGREDQLFGVKSYEMLEGKSNGVRCLDIKNGSGIDFTVVQDRGMDISSLSYKGVNIGYMSKTGVTNPMFTADGNHFFRGFYAGFMTTCGLRNVGPACECDGENHGIHGRISGLPAEKVKYYTEWNSNPNIIVEGEIRESTFFGENLVLRRSFSCEYGVNSIHIENEIENIGFKDELVMFLLHFNIGYPLLTGKTIFISSSENVIPRDDEAAKGIDAYSSMGEPTAGYNEQVFYHELNADKDGRTRVGCYNEELNLGLLLSFKKEQFDRFVQWKQLGNGEYVLGLEPSNCLVGGRSDKNNVNDKMILKSFEKKHFNVDIEFYENINEIKSAINKISES